MLNFEQKKVAEFNIGQMIVIACPGSGKTTTLITRASYLTHHYGVKPEQILMLTFTSASAKDMRERYQAMNKRTGTTFCTIHALCRALLIHFHQLKDGQLLSESEIKGLICEVIYSERIMTDQEAFIKAFLLDIGKLTGTMADLRTFEPTCTSDKDLFLRVWRRYREEKAQKEVIDFDDLLLKTYELLRDNLHARAFLQNRYRYIQVDEYQDVSPLQREILYMIAGENGNIVAVGDDDQSIYGFRGSDPSVMKDFLKHYPKAQVIYLSDNYRSGQAIVEHASALIRHNTERFEKDITAASSALGYVGILEYKGRDAQAADILKRIKDGIQSGVLRPADTAILFRTNHQITLFQDMCLDMNIPFVCTESIADRYESFIFKDICAMKRIIKGYGRPEDLRRMLVRFNRHIPAAVLKSGQTKEDLLRALARCDSENWVKKKVKTSIYHFFEVTEKMAKLEPSAFLQAMYKDLGYEKYLKRLDIGCDDSGIMETWKLLRDDAGKYSWHSWAVFIKERQKKKKENESKAAGITLSSMHKAKGLEWQVVFLADCNTGFHPYTSGRSVDLEEERRLFYVAMTRAKTEVYLSWCNMKGKQPSQFIREIF